MAIGASKLSGARVAVKEIPTEKYLRLAKEHKVSEAEAITMCKGNKRIIKLMDTFEIEGYTYIITKYEEGRNLLDYCLSQPDQDRWMSEQRARHIFL